MSFLSRLFGSRGAGKSVPNLEERLERLEGEAASAPPGYVGTSYNKAGDLALRGGEPDRAAEYYGRAIDAFLEDGQREAARGVANKIIRVRPRAVRTLCTLTWLDLAARHHATALLHLRDYVEAAAAVERHSLAAHQIHQMARLVPDGEFMGACADALDSLDFSREAEEVRAWVGSEGSPDALTDPEELASSCLRAAIESNSGKGAGEGRARRREKPIETDSAQAGEAPDGDGSTSKSRWE